MTSKDLITQYVDSGICLPRYQFDKLSSSDKKTYLRKILMTIPNIPNNISCYYGELPEETKLAAVRKDGNAIYRIENPSEEIQLAAVQEDPYSIRHIQNPSEAVQWAAFRSKPHSHVVLYKYIKNPAESIKALMEKLFGSDLSIYKDM